MSIPGTCITSNSPQTVNRIFFVNKPPGPNRIEIRCILAILVKWTDTAKDLSWHSHQTADAPSKWFPLFGEKAPSSAGFIQCHTVGTCQIPSSFSSSSSFYSIFFFISVGLTRPVDVDALDRTWGIVHVSSQPFISCLSWKRFDWINGNELDMKNLISISECDFYGIDIFCWNCIRE